jgi:hypothetical protein
MNDCDDRPAPQTGPLQYRLRTIFLVFFAVAVLLGFWTLCQRERFVGLEHMRLRAQCPISLHIVYVDNAATSRNDFHSGTATYIFKNNLPLKAAIAFPPISCQPDFMVPFAGDISSYVPDFCRKQRIVEFPPNGELRFTAKYGFVGDSAPRFLFMFGNPTKSRNASLLLAPVYSTSEFR